MTRSQFSTQSSLQALPTTHTAFSFSVSHSSFLSPHLQYSTQSSPPVLPTTHTVLAEQGAWVLRAQLSHWSQQAMLGWWTSFQRSWACLFRCVCCLLAGDQQAESRLHRWTKSVCTHIHTHRRSTWPMAKSTKDLLLAQAPLPLVASPASQHQKAHHPHARNVSHQL